MEEAEEEQCQWADERAEEKKRKIGDEDDGEAEGENGTGRKESMRKRKSARIL